MLLNDRHYAFAFRGAAGTVLPQLLHGGPGRAGGGEELGGLVGVKLYLQRVAVQGSKSLVDGLVEVAS